MAWSLSSNMYGLIKMLKLVIIPFFFFSISLPGLPHVISYVSDELLAIHNIKWHWFSMLLYMLELIFKIRTVIPVSALPKAINRRNVTLMIKNIQNHCNIIDTDYRSFSMFFFIVVK